MEQAFTDLVVPTNGQGMIDITAQIVRWLDDQRIASGPLTIFCQHTSASLIIQENAAPAARRDVERYFARIAPESPDYEHDDEGPDDMPAHLRTALTSVHLSIPVRHGAMALGTWQGIYLFEHRRRPHRRTLMLHLIGE